MVTRTVVQSALHTAAMALANLPPEEWAGWVTYLCQALEDNGPVSEETSFEAEAVYQEIIATLQQRIERGNW